MRLLVNATRHDFQLATYDGVKYLAVVSWLVEHKIDYTIEHRGWSIPDGVLITIMDTQQALHFKLANSDRVIHLDYPQEQGMKKRSEENIRARVVDAIHHLLDEHPGAVFTALKKHDILSIPEGDGMEIVFHYRQDSLLPSCETRYRARGEWFSLNRLGVSDSFYLDEVDDIRQAIVDQRLVVMGHQEHMRNTQPFNLGPITLFLTEQRKQAIIDDLKAGKTFTYHPNGFGTGYNFSRSPKVRAKWDLAQPSSTLVELVGHPVFVGEFDAD